MTSQQKRSNSREVSRQALKLLRNPFFLHLALRKVHALGLIGEERNALVVILAGISRTLPKSASVLVKGPTSSGKSTIVESCLKLFPRSCVEERAGLSGKALAYGSTSLKDKILFLNEYRCGKDAQQFTRLLQSQGQIKHEATMIKGGMRKTTTVSRVGRPVVLSTTTDESVFADDETRFLSVWVDESPAQSKKIVLARARKRPSPDQSDLTVWQKAMWMLHYKKGDFEEPPKWIEYVASRLPLNKVRIRRDWDRFLTFCCALALSRSAGRTKSTNISFPDYCIAYRILEPVFASTLNGIGSQERIIATAVATLNKRLKRSATVREIARKLKWNEKVVYKRLKAAAKDNLVRYEPGTHQKNLKPVWAIDGGKHRFLPSPKRVLRRHRDLGKKVKYADPFTGKWGTVHR